MNVVGGHVLCARLYWYLILCLGEWYCGCDWLAVGGVALVAGLVSAVRAGGWIYGVDAAVGESWVWVVLFT